MKGCAAPECAAGVGDNRLMCDRHWSKVPPALQTGIERTGGAWRAKRSDAAAFQAYRVAVDAAVRAVDPWHIDVTGFCCCPCHRGAGTHLAGDCACATVTPATCLRCRESIAVHALHPDNLHGDIATTCPDTYATWTPITGVTPSGIRASMPDVQQLELTGAPA